MKSKYEPLNFQVLFNYGNTTRNQRASLMIERSKDYLFYAGEHNDLIGTTVITDGYWHHVAATFDGTTLRLYVDGEKLAWNL